MCFSTTVDGINRRAASLARRVHPWGRQEIAGPLREKCRCRVPRTMARQTSPLRKFAIAAAHENCNLSKSKAHRNHRKRPVPDGLDRSFLSTDRREKMLDAARWPSIMLCQVGEFASSKSAMNIFAPELSALITHHLAISRPGDLNPPIAQIDRNKRARPVAIADALCFHFPVSTGTTYMSRE